MHCPRTVLIVVVLAPRAALAAAPPKPDSPQARCTDVFCLLFLVIAWLGVLIITFLSAGDLNMLRYGADYLGNRCGVGRMHDRPSVW